MDLYAVRSAHHLVVLTPSFFYKGWPIRDGNMGLVGMPKILRDVD